MSAVLGEYALSLIENRIRRTPGVYGVFRFADDFVIVSTNRVDLDNEISSCLPPELNFGATKKTTITTKRRKPKVIPNEAFDFLGYNFSFPSYCDPKCSRTIRLRISESKIRRIKSRMIMTFKRFATDGDLPLFVDRLKYLTGNRSIRKVGTSYYKQKLTVSSGIYHNYKRIGIHTDVSKHNPNPGDRPYQLIELDRLLKFLLFNKKSDYYSLISSLSESQRKELKKLSFLVGFQNKITHRFRAVRIADIKRAWNFAEAK